MEASKQPQEPKQKATSGRWSKQQHQRFMLGLMQYGKNWKKVQQIVATRSGSQVRSHAQKFFNKLQKQTNDQKNKKKSNFKHQQIPQFDQAENQNQDVSFTQHNDIVKSLNNQYSNVTPPEIISLIKKQSQDNRKVSLSNFKRTLQNQQKQKLYQENQFGMTENSGNINQQANGLQGIKLNSYKSMNNILSAYEALNQVDPQNLFEDQSFLIGITKKYKRFFSKGGQFENLIDFGNPKEVVKAIQLQKSQRKKSWTLAQGFQGDQNDLENIKNKIKQIPKQKKQLKVQNKLNSSLMNKKKEQEKQIKKDYTQNYNKSQNEINNIKAQQYSK